MPAPTEDDKVHGVVIGPSLVSVIDHYWFGLTELQNCLEDVSGADGRLEYLLALRWKLIGVLVALEGALMTEASLVGEPHRAAYALAQGLPRLGLSAEALRIRLGFDDPNLSAEALAQTLLAVGRGVIAGMPGDLPAAQGSTGQREVIRAMRLWSKAAEVNHEDIGFLAERLQEL
jgi:hypothetical protein